MWLESVHPTKSSVVLLLALKKPRETTFEIWNPMECLRDDICVFRFCFVFQHPSYFQAINSSPCCTGFKTCLQILWPSFHREVEANPSPWIRSGLREEKKGLKWSSPLEGHHIPAPTTPCPKSLSVFRGDCSWRRWGSSCHLERASVILTLHSDDINMTWLIWQWNISGEDVFPSEVQPWKLHVSLVLQKTRGSSGVYLYGTAIRWCSFHQSGFLKEKQANIGKSLTH